MQSFTSFSDETLTFTEDQEVIKYFTEGQCPALAFEIYNLTGYTLALLSSEPVGSIDYMGHVFIIDSNANAIDIKSRRPLQDIKDEWYFAKHIHRFWDLDEFEKEIRGWDLDTKYDRDLEAKYWAKIIVDLLH